MGILKTDKAGNSIVSNWDGSISVTNAQGKRVTGKDSTKFLKKHGFATKKEGKKLLAKPKSKAWHF